MADGAMALLNDGLARSAATMPDEEAVAFGDQRLTWACPRTVLVVEELPRNASGKVLKHELRPDIAARNVGAS